jgi:tryptophan-rich sensory protein
MKKLILRIDAGFICLAGVFGVASDLLSYFAGKGAFGQIFYKNPFVIAGVEAHLFAVMAAGFMWYLSKSKDAGSGSSMGIIVHLICGISNIIWFDVFTTVNAFAQGIVVTILHFLFVGLNAALIYKNKTEDSARFTEIKI